MLETGITDEASELQTRMDDAALNLSVIRRFFSGIIVESFDALLTSDGAKVTLTLTASAGGNLTLVFSDGATMFDLTGTKGVIDTDGILVAGSDTSPQKNYVYILQSTKALTVSASSFPTEAHIRIGFFFIPSATYVLARGAYINQNWNDHVEESATGRGHIVHLGARIRAQSAIYKSGAAFTVSVTGGGSVIDFALTAATVFQFHPHALASLSTNAGDPVLIVNQNGANYDPVTDLETLTNDAGGNPLSKYFNQYIWAVANKTGQYSGWFMNLPTGSYVKLSDAINDVDGHDVATLPAEFNIDSSTGYFIARLTWQLSGGVWTLERQEDLRGQAPASVAGGGVGVAQTEFADNAFVLFDESDATRELVFQLSAIATGTRRVITMADADLDTGNIVLADGSVPLTAPWDAGNDITGLTKLEVDSLTLDGALISSVAELTLTATASPILLKGTSFIFIASATDTDIPLTFFGTSNQGTLTYMEDEDEFRFSAPVLAAIMAGGAASGGDLTLKSTTHATKGTVLIGTAGGGDLQANKLIATELYNASGDLKLQPDVQGDVVLFGDTDVADAAAGKWLYVKRNAAEGDNYLRFRVSAGQVALLDTDAPMFLSSVGYIKLVAGNHMYFDLEDNTGSHKFHFRDSDKAAVATIDSNGNLSLPMNPLAILYGGSGQTTQQAAIDALTAVSGATDEYVLTKDTTSGNAEWKVAAGGGMNDLIDDTTPELGGELHAGAHTIGFTQQAVSYASGTTTVDWKLSNKAKMTFGAGDITTFAFTNPTNPCNLLLIIKQDGTGGRVVTAWDADILWVGGTAPTLSTGANDVDVLAFYWDGTNYFGQIALDFS